MLTENFYTYLSTFLKGGVTGSMYMAIGGGEPGWDQNHPPYQRNITALTSELARKLVSTGDVFYLDDQGMESSAPCPHLLIQMNFAPGEGEGTIRECGLFAGATASEEPGSGLLLSYYMHTRIEKGAGTALARHLHLNLTPRASGPGQMVTRYLGNSNSQELHDLENQQPACQIDEIRFDRRIYFGSPEQATGLGYDYCAFCFGRELSDR